MYDFLVELKQHLREQTGDFERQKEAMVKYLVAGMQEVFDGYIGERGTDDVTYMEEDGGVRLIYLKPFSLELEETVNEILAAFEDEITNEEFTQIVDEANEITSQEERDARGRLRGFWIDLVKIGAGWYEGEKFYADVFIDDAGKGKVQFGVDEPIEIYQIAIND